MSQGAQTPKTPALPSAPWLLYRPREGVRPPIFDLWPNSERPGFPSLRTCLALFPCPALPYLCKPEEVLTVSRLSLGPGSGPGPYAPDAGLSRICSRDKRNVADTPTEKKDGMLTFRPVPDLLTFLLIIYREPRPFPSRVPHLGGRARSSGDLGPQYPVAASGHPLADLRSEQAPGKTTIGTYLRCNLILIIPACEFRRGSVGWRSENDFCRPFRRRGKNGLSAGLELSRSAIRGRHVEVSDAGRQRLKDGLGVDAVPVEEALDGAEAVVLAVPDTAIGKVAAGIVKKLSRARSSSSSTPRRPMPAICRSARTSPISSPIPAIRRSSTTRRTWRRGTTISAASRPSSTSSTR